MSKYLTVVRNECNDLLFWPAVWITVVAGEPLRDTKFRREINPLSSGKGLLTEASIGHVLFNAPRGARLIATKPKIPSLEDRLPDNYTLILQEPLKDTFSCEGRVSCFLPCVCVTLTCVSIALSLACVSLPCVYVAVLYRH